MLNDNLLHCFPSAENLPDSDDTPVDNELQKLIPGLLKAILACVWGITRDPMNLRSLTSTPENRGDLQLSIIDFGADLVVSSMMPDVHRTQKGEHCPPYKHNR